MIVSIREVAIVLNGESSSGGAAWFVVMEVSEKWKEGRAPAFT